MDRTEVREWAKAQDIEVKDRGRVPAELVVEFKAATGQQRWDALGSGYGALRTCLFSELLAKVPGQGPA